MIKTVIDETGSKASSPEGISAKFQTFFQNLFTTSKPQDIQASLQHLEKKVNDEMNNKLLRKFTRQEVEEAVLNMAPLNSPGPNGFPPAFYQNHWPLVGKEVNLASTFSTQRVRLTLSMPLILL